MGVIHAEWPAENQKNLLDSILQELRGKNIQYEYRTEDATDTVLLNELGHESWRVAYGYTTGNGWYKKVLMEKKTNG